MTAGDRQRGLGAVLVVEGNGAGFGINGVPFFVFDRRLGVSGAQPPEVLLGALQEAAGEIPVG